MPKGTSTHDSPRAASSRLASSNSARAARSSPTAVTMGTMIRTSPKHDARSIARSCARNTSRSRSARRTARTPRAGFISLGMRNAVLNLSPPRSKVRSVTMRGAIVATMRLKVSNCSSSEGGSRRSM